MSQGEGEKETTQGGEGDSGVGHCKLDRSPGWRGRFTEWS